MISNFNTKVSRCAIMHENHIVLLLLPQMLVEQIGEFILKKIQVVGRIQILWEFHRADKTVSFHSCPIVDAEAMLEIVWNL